MKANKTILISEDHDMYREGVYILLNEMDEDITILQAVDFPSTLSVVENTPELSLLLLDIQMPGTRGLDGLKLLRQRFPLLPIVVVSMLEMEVNVRNIMALGASGFIAKSTTKTEFLKGLQAIFRGEIVTLTKEQGEDIVDFTPRHLDTLRLLAEGISNKEIAKKLNICDATVRQYVSEILLKLKVNNRIKAVLKAKKQGIIID